MKIGLGTAQFGLTYGITNREGQTPPEEVKRILAAAAKNGICFLDTAPLYGTSEEVLGRVLASSNHPFSIVTKTPRYLKKYLTPDDAQILEDTFHDSLAKMKQSSVYGLLIHHTEDLLAENGQLLIERMITLKKRGLVKKIGISVYNSRQIDAVLERYTIDLIQLPINVLDQRLLNSGHLKKLKKAGIEIHARSVFLQGILLTDPENLPGYFDSVKKHLQNYHRVRRQYGLSAIQTAIGFIAKQSYIDAFIFGITNRQQLEEICSAWYTLPEVDNEIDKFPYASFAVQDLSILNPSLWPA